MDPLADELPVFAADLDPFVADNPTPAFRTDNLVARMVRERQEVTAVRPSLGRPQASEDSLFGPLDAFEDAGERR